MASDGSKRSSDQHPQLPSNVPSPFPQQQQPPSAQRYSDVAKNVFEKLPFRIGPRKQFAQATATTSAADNRHGSFTSIQTSGSTASQSTHFDTGLKIRALDINRARTHVVLAGSKLLRTVRIDGTRCDEDFDIRRKTLDYLGGTSNGRSISTNAQAQPNRDVAATQRAFFDIEDVAWSNGRFDRVIATAASNGAILLYDLERPEVEAQKLQKHDRQVHKVDFNPIEGKCLLSGSQDGTVILWDLRVGPASRISCARSGIYDSRSDGVRHVKWSPVDDWSFAFSTDNGFVHRWDTRQYRSPVWKVAAHEGTCTSIDWHPDGRHVVSAGKDKTVKVWAVSQEQRRRKALYELRTPYEVQNVRWRPLCSILGPDATSYTQSTQLATSYKKEPILHVWDLRRPTIPFAEVHHTFNKGTTDMLWHSRDLLWTVGPGGRFMQSDIFHTPRIIHRRSLQTLSASSKGESTFFVQKRPRTFKTSFSPATEELTVDKSDKSKPHYFEGETLGRSLGDDSLDEKFLTPPFIRRSSSQTKPNSLSARSLGSTPPSIEDGLSSILPLDQSMKRASTMQPLQVSQTGLTPGLGQPAVFTYFARRFKLKALDRSMTATDFLEVQDAFEKNAQHMQRASRYRDAQTWKMLGKQMSIELKRRAESNRRRRLHSMPRLMQERKSTNPALRQHAQSLLKSQFDRSRGTKSWLPLPDTTSDAATPLARPVGERDMVAQDAGSSLDSDPVQLPPSITSNFGQHVPPHSQQQISSDAEGPLEASIEDDDSSLNQTISRQNERRAMVNEWKAQPKMPLNLDQPVEHSRHITVPPRMDRRDSSDSFLMFSTSSGSHPKMSAAESLGGRESRSTSTARDPAGWASKGIYDPSSFQSTQSDGTGSSDVASEPRPFDIETSVAGSPEISRQAFRPSQSGSLSQSFESNRFAEFNNSSFSAEGSSIRSSNAVSGETDSSIVNAASKQTSKLHSISELGRYNDVGDSKPAQLPANIKLNGEENVLNENFIALDFSAVENPEIQGLPVSAADMLLHLVAWYSSQADAQMASTLIIQSLSFLAPSLSFPDAQNVSREAASALDCVSSFLGYPGESISSDESDKHLKVEALRNIDLDPELVESILETYHEQLVSQHLLVPAADLRNVAYPGFPAVYDQGIKDVQTGLVCLQCKSPINNPDNKLRCETCFARQADCPICWSRESPFGASPFTKFNKKGSPAIVPVSNLEATPEQSNTKLWSSCPLCNHGAHAACAFRWFEDIEAQGACPVSGCLCDCTRGAYRDERLAKVQAQELQRASRRGGVKKDEWAVIESRAVGRVRGALKERSSMSSGEAGRRVSGGEVERADEERRVRIRAPVSMKGASG